MQDNHAVPDAEAFAAVFRRMEAERRLSDNDKAMLVEHYNAPAMTLTAREMSARMGWGGQMANRHYGGLGKRVAEYLDWTPPERIGLDDYFVAALVLGSRRSSEFEWTLRPQIADALQHLNWPGLIVPTEDDAGPSGLSVVERAKFEWQKRLERNIGGPLLAKSSRGYKCEACDMTFADTYGEIGANFIEAHHKQPLATIQPGEERTYTADDFAVLCSNCHRMIHRWPSPNDPTPEDVEGFRAMVQGRRSMDR